MYSIIPALKMVYGELLSLLLPAAIVITVHHHRHYWDAGRESSQVVPASLIYSSPFCYENAKNVLIGLWGIVTILKLNRNKTSVRGINTKNECHMLIYFCL